jgi:ATP/maltotriose-dependent transcriptional regulator MalT
MSTASIARALRAQAMPSSEIRAALSTDDPEMLHRLVELHEERLEERHAAQVRTLREIERSLTASLRRR